MGEQERTLLSRQQELDAITRQHRELSALLGQERQTVRARPAHSSPRNRAPRLRSCLSKSIYFRRVSGTLCTRVRLRCSL